MAKVKFIEHSGKEHVVDGDVGSSIMQIALDNGVPGLLADCGGSCSCATCHGYVDSSWKDKLGDLSEVEIMMLDSIEDKNEQSRLTCQIHMTEELDGIVIRWPEHQG